MRSDLKTAEGVVEFATNLDELACQITIRKDVDLKKLLDELAKTNDKFEDWSIQ